MTVRYKKSIVQDKATYINQLFSSIATKYDLLNNLISFGMHKKWKEELIKLALKENPNPHNFLDLCSGTCDLAIALNKFYQNTNITCVDNCKEMLNIAKHKFQSLKLNHISLLCFDFENLNLTPSSFDLITISFGLRNLVQREESIKKIFNLLRNNGVFACIDLGHIKNNVWGKIFYTYFFNLIPIIGKIFSPNKEAYEYLVNSLKTWYTQEELKELILMTGFKKCYFKNIFGGAVAIHIAVK